MVNLIDYTVFKGKLLIANAANDTDVQTFLTEAITTYQEDFLRAVLGPALYKQFTEWYAIDPSDTTNMFYYLLNGMLFEYTAYTHEWVGLRKPLANYVYFYVQRENATQTTSPGEAITQAQNAERSGPYNKQKSAWDEMAAWLWSYERFMQAYYSVGTGAIAQGNVLPYHAPVQVVSGVTPGIVAGSTSFTFDGTAGTPDWRGYDVYPERIGQGTMLLGAYSWVPATGVFTLLGVGDSFQVNEAFNYTFGLGGITFIELASNAWLSYHPVFKRKGLTQVINPF